MIGVMLPTSRSTRVDKCGLAPLVQDWKMFLNGVYISCSNDNLTGRAHDEFCKGRSCQMRLYTEQELFSPLVVLFVISR